MLKTAAISTVVEVGPSSFELLMLELNELGLTALQCETPLADTNEFVVRLTKRTVPQVWSKARRKLLMLKVITEVASKAPALAHANGGII